MRNHITFCQMTLNNIDKATESIKRAQPYVDRIIVVDGGSIDETIPTLKGWKGVELYIHPWKDNFSNQRNKCLQYCKDTDWILFMDPDEWLPKLTGENLQKIVDSVGKHDLIRFKCRDIDLDGDRIRRDASTTFYKPIMFKYYANNMYLGNLHETIKVKGEDALEMKVEHEYYHVKQELSKTITGARNLFIGGSGIEKENREARWTELWVPFRKAIKDITGIDKWVDFNSYMIKGNMDQEIKDIIIKNKLEVGYDGARDWGVLYNTYFMLYHPEEHQAEWG